MSRRSLNSRLFRWHQARRARRADLAAVRRSLADTRRPGRGRDPRAARGVGRAWLQPSGPRATRVRPEGRLRPSRSCASRSRGARVAARDRSLHGPRRRGLGLRRAGRTPRCERPARRFEVVGRAGIIVGPSNGSGRPRLPWRTSPLARRRHGSRVSHVHASRALMRGLSAGDPVCVERHRGRSRAESRSHTVPADDPLASGPLGRGRHRGTGRKLGDPSRAPGRA